MKKGWVYKKEKLSGIVWEDENGYHFQYEESYLQNPVYGAVSRTLPLRSEEYTDRMTLLLTLCKDCIGDISIRTEE